MPWFHGKITRDEAERLLLGESPSSSTSPDGLFLVRESTNFPGDYTLCVVFQVKVEHYRVIALQNRLVQRKMSVILGYIYHWRSEVVRELKETYFRPPRMAFPGLSPTFPTAPNPRGPYHNHAPLSYVTLLPKRNFLLKHGKATPRSLKIDPRITFDGFSSSYAKA